MKLLFSLLESNCIEITILFIEKKYNKITFTLQKKKKILKNFIYNI